MPHAKVGQPEVPQIDGWVEGIESHRPFDKINGLLRSAIKDQSPAHFHIAFSVVRIEGKDRVTGVVVKNRENDKEKKLDANGVFVEIGLLPNNESVKDLVELNEQGEVIVDCSCKTSVQGLFGAGDVTTVPEKQISVAIGEGSKAALSAYKYILMNA